MNQLDRIIAEEQVRERRALPPPYNLLFTGPGASNLQDEPPPPKILYHINPSLDEFQQWAETPAATEPTLGYQGIMEADDRYGDWMKIASHKKKTRRSIEEQVMDMMMDPLGAWALKDQKATEDNRGGRRAHREKSVISADAVSSAVSPEELLAQHPVEKLKKAGKDKAAWVLDWLGELQRPFHALYGGLANLNPEAEESVAQGVKKGFLLEDRKGFFDAMAGLQPPGAAVKMQDLREMPGGELFAAGLDLIAPDPLFGIGKAVKAAKATERGMKAWDVISGSPVGKALLHNAGGSHRDFDKFWDKAKAAGMYESGKSLEEMKAVSKEIDKRLTDAGFSPEEIQNWREKALFSAMERPKGRKRFARQYQEIVDLTNPMQAERFRLQVENDQMREVLGMAQRGLVGEEGLYEQMPRVLSGESRWKGMKWWDPREAKKEKHREIYKWVDDQGQVLHIGTEETFLQKGGKKIETQTGLPARLVKEDLPSTSTEYKDWFGDPVTVKQASKAEAEKVAGQIWIKDPLKASAVDMTRKQHENQFLKFMVEAKNHPEWMRPIEQAPEGWRPLRIPGLEHYATPKAVANRIENTARIMADPETFLGGIEKLADVFFNDTKAGVLLKHYRQWWARNQLALHPGYHARNAVSNLTLVWLGDMRNPYRMIEADRLQRATGKPILRDFGYDISNADLFEEYARRGAANTGFSVSESINELTRQARPDMLEMLTKGGGSATLPGIQRGVWVKAADRANYGRVTSVTGDWAHVHFVNPETGATQTVKLPTKDLERAFPEDARGLPGLGAFGAGAEHLDPDMMIGAGELAGTALRKVGKGWERANEAGFAFGNYIENNAKLAVAIDETKKQLKKGASLEEALDAGARKSREFLFDYTDLTPLEEHLKNFRPFLSWERNIIGRVLTDLGEQPHRYARLERFHDIAFTPVAQQDKEIMDSWMKEQGMTVAAGGIPYGKSPEGKPLVFGLGGYSPLQTIESFYQRPSDAFMGGFAPWWKGFYEGPTNTDTFRNKPIDPAAGGPLRSMFNAGTGSGPWKQNEQLFGLPYPAGLQWAIGLTPASRYLREFDALYEAFVKRDPYHGARSQGDVGAWAITGGKLTPFIREIAVNNRLKELGSQKVELRRDLWRAERAVIEGGERDFSNLDRIKAQIADIEQREAKLKASVPDFQKRRRNFSEQSKARRKEVEQLRNGLMPRMPVE
ncbi:MAG: hypothetical protein ACOYXY_21890 [Thermodesulfobacteriota bacterium]